MAAQKKTNYLWIVLFIVFGLVFWLVFGGKKGKSNEEEINPNTAIYDGPDSQNGDEESSSAHYQPQYSEDNPIPQSLDPFTPQDDFEVLANSSKNKSDFDFSFAGYEETRAYTLNAGKINFELKGSLKTGINMEDNVGLLVEFYTNDQISFTKRKKYESSVLAFIKESKERDKNDKNLYSFDFEKQLEVTPGLHYFTIVPQGRNRVLYVGKFSVR